MQNQWQTKSLHINVGNKVQATMKDVVNELKRTRSIWSTFLDMSYCLNKKSTWADTPTIDWFVHPGQCMDELVTPHHVACFSFCEVSQLDLEQLMQPQLRSFKAKSLKIAPRQENPQSKAREVLEPHESMPICMGFTQKHICFGYVLARCSIGILLKNQVLQGFFLNRKHQTNLFSPKNPGISSHWWELEIQKHQPRKIGS